MNVVRHQAVSPNPQEVLFAMLPQQPQVELAIRIGEEDILLVIAPLRYVVRQTRNNDSCNARHQ